MNITYIQPLVTGKTAPFQGAGVDVSPFVGNWTLRLQVAKMTGTGTVRFQFTDSVDNFGTIAAGATFSFKAPIVTGADIVRSISWRDARGLRVGQQGCQLRLDITGIDAGTSVDYCAWLESA